MKKESLSIKGIFFLLAIALLFILVSFNAHAASASFAANSTWTAPAGILNSSITVEVWGGGGGAGRSGANPNVGGGGGGGGYSRTVFYNISAGQVFNVTVGNGGAAGSSGTNPGLPGTPSWFNTSATIYGDFGRGGAGAASGAAGGAGGCAGNIGTVKYCGGTGGTSASSTGGGGGGGAGTTQNGSAASGGTAGAGGNLNGGTGGTGGTTGSAGSVYGGGGGALYTGAGATGGAGADGGVRISWFAPNELYIQIYDETNASLITQNVTLQIMNGSAGNIITAYTTNGTLQLQNLSTGTVSVVVSSLNYGSRTYFLEVTNTSINNVVAYLSTSANTVTFNVIDSISSSVITDALVQQYTLLGSTLVLVDMKLTDITGNAQMNYIAGNLYTFVISASGYNNKTFTLYPILASAYTIKMVSPLSMNFSEDFQNVLITYSPSALMANSSNNFTILFDSVTNSFQTYSYNITYPGGSSAGSGTAGAGQTFITNFTINGGNIFSTANLTIIYNTGFGNKTFYYPLTIIYGPNSGTIAANIGNTYGMGLIERALIGTIIIVIVAGMISITVGSLPALLVSMFLMGLFIKIGLWEWWLAGISFLVGMALISRRTE